MLDQLKQGLAARALLAVGWASLGALGAMIAAVYPAVHQAFCQGQFL